MNGVIPAFDLIFKIGKLGRTSVAIDMVTIKDMEGLVPTIDGSVQEWSPMDTHGWVRRLLTAKSFSLSMTGKRNYGDPGNDYVAGLSYKNGTDANSVFEITFPNGDSLKLNCVVNVKTPFGGESTAANTLEFDILSDGEPVYTEATQG